MASLRSSGSSTTRSTPACACCARRACGRRMRGVASSSARAAWCCLIAGSKSGSRSGGTSASSTWAAENCRGRQRVGGYEDRVAFPCMHSECNYFCSVNGQELRSKSRGTSADPQQGHGVLPCHYRAAATPVVLKRSDRPPVAFLSLPTAASLASSLSSLPCAFNKRWQRAWSHREPAEASG